MPLQLPIYQVDAFADALFAGNPAAVMPLEAWLPDSLLLRIAAENNLSETAFLVADEAGYALRWFTPAVEIPLCGHATLASAHIVFQFLRQGTNRIRFSTRQAGELVVTRDGDMLALDFPARPAKTAEIPDGLNAALGLPPEHAGPELVLTAGNLFCVFRRAADVASLSPDFRLLAALPYHGVVATAPGDEDIDFVSRYFAPQAGIDEDPVTGSTHCTLIPYWAARLGKTTLEARQISARGGSLTCVDLGSRVSIAGRAQLYMTGMVSLP